MTAPARTDAALVLALWAAGLGAAAQFGKISVIYAPLGAHYGGGPGTAFLVSLVGLVGLVLGTTAGVIVRGLGARRVLTGALLAGAAISALQAALPPLPWMLASRVVEGVSHLAIVVAAPTVIAGASAPRHMGLTMTLWASFFGVSFALTAWAGLPLVAAYGLPALFLAHAGAMAALAGLLALRMPPDPPPPELPPLTLAGLAREHRRIYASPRIAAPAYGFLFYTLMYVALLTLLPPMLPEASRGFVAGAMPLTSIAVSLTLGVWALTRISGVRLVQAGLGLGAVAALALWAFWGQGTAVLVASLALAAALGLVQGASFAAIPELNADPADRSRAAGALAQLGNVGTTSGTPILAAMIAAGGVDALLGFVLPLCLGGVAVHGWMARRRLNG